MEENRSIHVSCPECQVEYRLWDETLLSIARCGRCYGAVVREEEPADTNRPIPDP
jgi:Zn-finger nucleic acid-binding protein